MPPADSTDVAIALSKIESMTGDLQDIKTSMRDLARAVNRLAVVEERQASIASSMERAFKEIETMSARLASLEQAKPINDQTNKLMAGAVKYILAAAMGAVLSGIVRNPTPPIATPPAIVGK